MPRLDYLSLSENEKEQADRISQLFNDPSRASYALNEYAKHFRTHIEESAFSYGCTKMKSSLAKHHLEDLVQECFLRLLKSRVRESQRSFANGGDLFGFTFCIINNLWREYGKARKRAHFSYDHSGLDETDVSEPADPSEWFDLELELKDCAEAVELILKDVRPEKRKAWIANKIRRVSQTEIAGWFGRSRETINKWIGEVNILLENDARLEGCREAVLRLQ